VNERADAGLVLGHLVTRPQLGELGAQAGEAADVLFPVLVADVPGVGGSQARDLVPDAGLVLRELLAGARLGEGAPERVPVDAGQRVPVAEQVEERVVLRQDVETPSPLRAGGPLAGRAASAGRTAGSGCFPGFGSADRWPGVLPRLGPDCWRGRSAFTRLRRTAGGAGVSRSRSVSGSLILLLPDTGSAGSLRHNRAGKVH
jgi:hypothetical protein